MTVGTDSLLDDMPHVGRHCAGEYGFVVLGVAVPPAGAFKLLDRGVRGFSAGVSHPGDEQDLDLGPPSVDGFSQPPRLGHVRDRDDGTGQDD